MIDRHILVTRLVGGQTLETTVSYPQAEPGESPFEVRPEVVARLDLPPGRHDVAEVDEVIQRHQRFAGMVSR